MQEVAHLAKVSTATVSRVFNEPAKVSETIQARVREAAAALNWIPDAAGRALASSRTHIAGAIIPTLDNEIFARQVSGLQAVFAERGFTLFLGCSNYDPAEASNQVRAMLSQGVQALAIVGEDHPPRMFEAIRQRRIPYVVTYAFRRDSPHPCIGFDNRAAFRQICDHVLSLGHRHVAAVFQPTQGNDRVSARLEGLRDSLGSHGLELAPADIHVGPSTMDFGAESLGRIMAAKRRPTAIICGNDNLALGAVNAALALGYAIPDDLSVTGFDDLTISSRFSPHLTTMWVDNLEIGRLAARQLLAATDGVSGPTSFELRPEMRIRSTTKAVDGPREGDRQGSMVRVDARLQPEPTGLQLNGGTASRCPQS